MWLIQCSTHCKQRTEYREWGGELCNAISYNLDKITCRPPYCHRFVLLKWPLIKSVKMLHRWSECIHAIPSSVSAFFDTMILLFTVQFFSLRHMIFPLFIDFSIPFSRFAHSSIFFMHLIKLSGKYFHKEIFAYCKILVQMISLFSSIFFAIHNALNE